jgi:arabinose-5-phosphate isomerase
MSKSEYEAIVEASFLHDINELQEISSNIAWGSIIDAGEIILKAEHVITIGVGKSAIMAKRLSASLTSIGVKSVYLHPIDALHGDIGIIGSDDVIVLFSNSGNTEEIVSIMPFLSMRASTIIGILGNSASILSRHCDITINAEIQREGCPLNIVPTTSLLVATALSNALIIAIMHLGRITKDDFAKSHPAGQLGRNLLLTVDSVMVKGSDYLPFVKPDQSLKDLLIIMSAKKLGCAIVSEDSQKISGFVTDGDIRRCLSGMDQLSSILVKDIMTINPIMIHASASLGEALSLMEDRENKIGVLPVINEVGACIGIVRLHDIAGHIR